MNKAHRLLVVEDDPDTAHLLKLYFSGHGYVVDIAERGQNALDAARQHVPDLILLDIMLPEMDGYAVCHALRQSPRTAYVPVIFLSEKTSPSDKRAGLGAGAQDYVTKPFDLEELRLRVQNLIARHERENMLDPRSNLPTGRMVDEQLRLIAGKVNWYVIECRIEAFRPFLDLNGFAAGDDVLKFTAGLIREAVTQHGSPEDFVGHPANDTFLILSRDPDPAALAQEIRARFNRDVLTHYSFIDREQGYITIRDSRDQLVQAPLMTLSTIVRPA